MKTLVVYYSHTGNNEAVVRELQKRLHCDLFQVVETTRRSGLTILLDLLFKRDAKIKAPDIHLELYDRIVLMAPIWAGRIATPMKTFIKMERRHLNRYSFITVCSGVAGQAEEIRDELILLSGRMPANITELMINDLLPSNQKNKIKYTTPYRIQESDLSSFDSMINLFIQRIGGADTPK